MSRRRDGREECTRRCGRAATCAVTRLRDGRTRVYCTECSAEAIEVFGDAIKVDPLGCPQRANGEPHEWVDDPALGESECLWCMVRVVLPDRLTPPR